MEFAIVAPLIFSLMVGMFTGGISMSRKNSMTNAVREGARLGATLADNGAWAGSVRDRVRVLSSSDLTNSQICAKLIYKPTATTETVKQATSCSLDPVDFPEPSAADLPALSCAVKVWAGRTSELQAIFFSRDLKLNASALSYYERTCGS